MSDATNETNFIILDACRNNPFERSWQRSPSVQGLSYMSAPYSTLIAYSTAPDKTASDGDGNNGLYTSILIDEITSPFLTILQVLQNVRIKMINLSHGEQVPWESTSLLNDFIFNDNQYTSISTFCKSIIYNGESDITLNNLNLDSWDLSKLSDLNLAIHNEDSEAGVIEIYLKSKVLYFDIFDNLEIQLNKNGERDYNLFTVTKNAEKVYQFSRELFNTLGGGLYDDERAQTFRDFDKIKNIARGRTKMSIDQCFTIWIFDNVSFILKYLTSPKRQFVFTINVKPTKKVIENTLCALLTNDYNILLKSGTRIEPTDEHRGKFVDFQLTLKIPELNLFDKVTVRVFTSKNKSKSETTVFLSNSNNQAIDIPKIQNLIGKITSIYGQDTSGEGYLTGYEENNLLEGRYWSGRSWDLNVQHQLYDLKSSVEEIHYGIHLNSLDEMNKFQLTIYGYQNLVNYQKKKILTPTKKS